MVFDLAGDGKTVLKANYGLYWHNPGVGIRERQPEHRQQVVARWSAGTTHNGDRRWQPGEETHARSRESLQGAIRLNPDIKAPFSHEASAWVERQLTETMGMRAGFVYKTEDDLITPTTISSSAARSAYTAPFTFVDSGVDGVRGTADDRTSRCSASRPPTPRSSRRRSIVDQPRSVRRYKTLEVSMNRRYATGGQRRRAAATRA